MDKQALKEFVESNPRLVSKKPAGDGIYVLKYRRRVFYDSLWNDFLEECRGTIIDDNYDIVSYPFTKIYNYGIEAKAPVLSDDTTVTMFRKVNGFMGAITWHNNGLLISTTGSTDSEYVDMIRELIDVERYRKVCALYPTKTFMFECVHKNDPHIIPEEEGMYLLGWREKSWNSAIETDVDTINVDGVMANRFGCHSVLGYRVNLEVVLHIVKHVKHEGFVFYTDNGVSAKIKSPYYLIKKFVARNPRTDKLMNPQVKQTIDEEYYPLIDHIQANIVEYTALDEQARLAWVRDFFEREWHTCPYKEDIHGDSESMCRCTSEQMQECANDI
jgi:hypothetical protein